MNPFLTKAFKGHTSWIKPLGYTLIVLAAVFMLWLSWFRWLNPQIDFGRELYTAWRITEGDLPVRDMFRLFGPLSDYWNAFWFSIFGASLNTIVVVNLVIYAFIVSLLFVMLKRVFGFVPALLASIMGVMIYGFGDYNGWGNYNYVTPYSHGATHGVLLLVILMFCLTRRTDRRMKWHSWVEGGVMGLLCLTKVEFIFVGVVLTGMQLLRYFWIYGIVEALKYAAQFIGACIALLLIVWILFCTALSPKEAAEAAWTGFMPFQSGAFDLPFQKIAIGNNETGRHVLAQLKAFLGALAGIGIVVGLTRLLFWKIPEKYQRWGVPLVLGAAVALATLPIKLPLLGDFTVFWPGLGRIFLLGLLTILGLQAYRLYKANKGVRTQRRRPRLTQRTWTGLVLVVVGLAMLARMFLFVRFYHYGFYQSMIGGVVCFAFIFRYVPVLAGKQMRAQVLVFVCLLVVSVIGVGHILKLSNFYYRNKQTLIGVWEKDGKQTTRDAFYVVNPNMNPTGLGLWRATQFLKEKTPNSDSLVVMPEGVMMNFWLKRKNPTHVVAYNPDIYGTQRERIFEMLNQNIPDEIVLVSRVNIAEFGIKHFGETDASGKALLDWINANYVQMGSIGKTAFDPMQFGAIIYKSKASLPQMRAQNTQEPAAQ